MPIDVQSDTSGLDGLMARLAGADKVVRTAALQVQANAQKEIQTGTKSGRIYKRGAAGKGERGKNGRFLKAGSQKTHQASAPGEAPATDTGNLVNGILAQSAGDADWEVSVAAEYAAKLEDGRPFIQPAVDKVEPSFMAAALKLLDG